MVEVVVVGGGIGGLAAAFAQARAGRAVRVLERSAAFGEVGAGLQLGPNATRVLHRWGLLDQVTEKGVLPRRLVFRDALTGEELTHLDLGEGFRHRYGGPYVVAHRGDLHAVLLRACTDAGVELLNGRHVERVDAGRARTHCADGEVHEGDVVVAADGLQSVLRAQLVADQTHDSGFVAYRGMRPLPEDFDVSDVVAYLGPDCHFVQYALRGGELLNQVAVFRGPGDLEPAFDDCCEAIGKGLPYLWRERHWPMLDRPPTGTWVRGRLALLGDAAHPMLQYLAQGACQAIEDAHELAEQSAAGDWDRALAAYQEIRAPRTARVQTTARLWGDIWHVDGVARVLRNELFRTRDPAGHAYVDWLYGRPRPAARHR
ncbi:FAD-dependent monooxygenase [Nonomuraea angiospora]|uniref:FAD-dependent monooxygenase n=1 Tax=Nonomuraea angiospora TaxID=46172 RepID=UPI0029A701A5|nr:FAD-dependent monooxygenase [Nonomuraea angiospora]MDX3111708.1 FAD-dependent monooxygenase [Nonomuraea angiospora]